MPIVLCRVDERLVHGQVVLGWGANVRPSRYIIVDADLADAEWEQELYRLGLPTGATAEFQTPEEAAEHLPDWVDSEIRTLVLFRGLGSVVELAKAGVLKGESVNLGGIHYAPGRREILPFLHLEQEDLGRIRSLDECGVEVVAQELPGSPRWDGDELIRRGSRLWND